MLSDSDTGIITDDPLVDYDPTLNRHGFGAPRPNHDLAAMGLPSTLATLAAMGMLIPTNSFLPHETFPAEIFDGPVVIHLVVSG